ncbi:MAG: hypothetical protein V4731_02300 [Pseudomonadota bacterium]
MTTATMNHSAPNQAIKTVLLHAIAHSRSGDKGDISNIALFAYRPEDFNLLVREVTETRVAELFRERQPASLKRYLLPRLGCMNFVIDGVLDGGVNSSLNLDLHGKALSSFLLTLPIEVPQGFIPWTSRAAAATAG